MTLVRDWLRLALMSGLASTTTAMAGAESAESDESGAKTGALEEILVTAQRRAENTQEIPVSVTPVDESALTRFRIETPQDLPLLTTSLTFGSQVLYGAPYIRGIGSDTTTLGTESSVALYVDGIYYARQYALLQTLNNVERVEVLKGPQGALYGRNATGGAINIVTRTPRPGFSGDLEATTGNYGLWGAKAYMSGGTERVAMSVSGYIKRHAGYYTNLVTGHRVEREDDYGGMAKLVWSITDNNRLTLSADVDSIMGPNGAFASQLGTTNVLATVFPGACYPSTPHLTCADQEQRIIAHNWQHNSGTTARWETNFPDFDFVVVSGSRHSTSRSAIDVDASSAPFIYFSNEPPRGDGRPGEKYDMWSIEPQLISHNTGPFTWLLGAMYLREHGEINVTIEALNQFAQQTVNHIKDDAYAFYGSGTYKFGAAERWNITGGLRYAKETKGLRNQSRFIYLGGYATGVATPPTLFPDESKSWNDTLGSVSLGYTLKGGTLYLKFAQGFKSGAYNTNAPGAPPVNPEKLNSVEAGIKSTLAQGRLELNAAGFYYDYKDLQIEVQDTHGGASLENAAKAKVKGFEADARARPIPSLELRAGVSYLDAYYTSFPHASVSAPCSSYGIPAPENCTPGDPTSPAAAIPPPDLTGNQLPRAPKVTGNIAAVYSILVPFGTFELSAAVSHSGNFFFEANNRLRQSAFTLVNASAAYRTPDDRWFARFWGNNLTDANHLDYVSAVVFGDFAHWADPRTFGVTLGYSFK